MFNFLTRSKWSLLDPDENPYVDKSQSKAEARKKLFMMLGVLALISGCVGFRLLQPAPAVEGQSMAEVQKVTNTPTLTVTLTPTPGNTSTPTVTPTTIVVSRIVQMTVVVTQRFEITRIVSVAGPAIVTTKLVTVNKIITATPGPTQTPWIITVVETADPGTTQTPWIVEVTREVYVTPTLTPTPTVEPSITPTKQPVTATKIFRPTQSPTLAEAETD